MHLESGQTIARYRLVELLGEGGMGVVWRADDLELGRPVALKFLTAETLAREDMRARFLREARTAASLNHPGICTIYEVGEHDGVPFIAMELIEGTPLDRMLAERGEPLRLSEIERIGSQVAAGLAAAHARKIVHRDLKPGNVILTDDGRAKILDFGLAKPQAPVVTDGGTPTRLETISAEMTAEGRIVGTVQYMSPEQAEGKPVDSRSDVFAFGVLLYQLATGKLPFSGDTTASTLAKILESEAEPVSVSRQGLPVELDRIVRRCLQKRPEDRFNDTRDLVAALGELRSTGESPAAVAASPASPWRRLLPAVAVLAGGVLIWFLVGRDRGTPEVLPGSETPSVAVLPFHNLSADADNEYFSAGMTEEIISKLSRIDGLEVASRSSVARYQDAERDAQTIGAELGVRYLLEGSVRRVGDRVRISAQLVDGSTGRNLWSQDFDGSLDDVFAMQEETALEIADQLDLQLSPEEAQSVQRRSTDSVQAYDAYLRAHAALRDWSDMAKLDEARTYYEKALEHDPDYAPALAGLASVEAQTYRNFDSNPERIERAEQLAERALSLDLGSGRAHMTLGEIAAIRYDYERAAQLLREAARLEPKDPIHWDYLSWVLAYQTPPDSEGAVEAARKALELQPDFPGAFYHLGRGLLQLGRNDEAREAFERSLELNAEFSAGFIGMAQYHLAVGEHDAAHGWLDKGWNGSVMELFYSASIHADAGDHDRAMERLEQAFDAGFTDFAALDASPYLAALHDDPRYRNLLRTHRD